MKIVVHKYGGSSVKDVASIQRVAAQVAEIHRSGTRVVVVVSAMGNTTNELLQLPVAPEMHPFFRTVVRCLFHDLCLHWRCILN